MTTSEIVIDSREPWEQIFEKMGELDTPEYRLDALDHKADFIIRNGGMELGIQRKHIDDFTSSIGDLKENLEILRTNYQRGALLIEDDWKLAGGAIAQRRGDSWHQTITVKSLHNFVLSQQLRGTLFFKTSDLSETVRFLVNAHGYMAEPVGGETAKTPIVLLTTMPEIGPSTAGKLVSQYGSVGAAIEGIDTWENVRGIGPKTVENVKEWMHGEQ